MKKIRYLSRKLKAFTFEDIFLLAETPKEKLQSALQELIEEGVLKKTNQGYVFCEFKQIPPPTEPVVRNTATKFIQDEDFVEFTEINTPNIKNLTSQELEEIPEYNRKKRDKYLHLLKITNGLHGKKLMEFIDEYNQLNPSNRTSYANLIRKRNAYVRYGDIALISKFGTPRKSYYPDMEEYYAIFKKFYLSNYGISIRESRENTAKIFQIPLEKFPSVMTFRRRLRKDFSSEEIRNIRKKLCF